LHQDLLLSDLQEAVKLLMGALYREGETVPAGDVDRLLLGEGLDEHRRSLIFGGILAETALHVPPSGEEPAELVDRGAVSSPTGHLHEEQLIRLRGGDHSSRD